MGAAYLRSPGSRGYVPNSCSKVCFASRKEAAARAKTMGKNPLESARGHLNVYFCPLGCGGWHVGHRKGKKP